MGINEIIFFTGFLLFIGAMLALDLGVLSSNDKPVSFREAATWSAVWILLALGFYVILLNYGELIHGIYTIDDLNKVVKLYVDSPEEVTINANNLQQSFQSYRNLLALEFITGWLLEYSLSVDNIFVIILIFTSFKVPQEYYKKVLLYGILGAVFMRFVFIFAGSVLIHQFNGILLFFGALLIYSGIKMFFVDEDESIDTENHSVVKFASRYFAVTKQYDGDRFFVKDLERAKTFVTPLFVVVLIIEFTDLLFAVDSVPAVFGVTQDPYIVFFSNIFAIMGLRSMFFFLSNIMHLFHYLKTGLAFLLVFIGVKMLVPHDYLKAIHYKTEHSLWVILAILTISVVASLLFPKKHEN